jgi:hypothetical protein
MSRTLASLAALAIIAAPAAAAGYGFSSEYTGARIPTIGTLNVTINSDLVREVHSTVRADSYGSLAIAPSDAEDLVESLREELEADLSRTGVYAPMVAQPVGTLNVTIERAAPSNPAHTENGRNRGLDFRSAGRGGATVTAELLGPDGAPIAEYSYRWEESSFDVGAMPRIGWYGAERAFERFSDRLARELTDRAGGVAS